MHAASCAPRGRPSPALSRPGRRSAALAVALARGAVAVALVVAAPAASRAAQLEPSPGERAQVVEVPAGAWSGDEVPAGWSLLETRSFQLQSRLDRERTAALGRHLDSLLELYRGLLPASARSDRLVVKVLADEDEYRAYGKPASRFGRYDEESGEVVVWNTRLVLGQPELTAAIRLDPDRVTTLTFAENQAVLHLADRATLAYTPDLGGVLGRLCWRQYLDQWVWPRDPPALPAWLEQGLAEHFATAAPGPRGRARTGLNAARLRELPWLLLDGETRSLGELLSPDAGTPPFEAGPGPAAQGWSLVHFLLASEEPRRRLLVPGLLAELRRGARLGPAAAAVFEDVDLEQLQADWQAWAASQPCDDPLADLARRYGDKVRPDQLTGDQDLERRYAWLWRRRDGPQPGDPP